MNSTSEARRIEGRIVEAMAQGARRLAGGPRQGPVVPPTLLDGVTPDMRLGGAGVFGPVPCIEPSDSIAGAIERADASALPPFIFPEISSGGGARRATGGRRPPCNARRAGPVATA